MASATTTNSPAPAQSNVSAANAAFLKFARISYDVQQVGSITGSPATGPGAIVNWSPQTPPVTPAWADQIIIVAQVPYSISVPAGATIHFSPFFPYCMFAHNLTLGGAPPFATPVSGTPFYLDEITKWQDYDLITGPSPDTSLTNVGATFISANSDHGSLAFTTGNANVVPGGSYDNTGTGTATLTGTAVFTYRIWLKRKRRGMWGCIPLGDPENRPNLAMYLYAFVGTQPQNNWIQDPAAAGATAVLTGTVNVYATWRALQLDILPPGMGQLPQPVVGLGLTVDTNNGLPIVNAGQIVQVQKRSAMIYIKMLHFVVNGQVGQRCDYFGLWTTGQQQSARYEFDSSQNNFQNYYIKMHDVYQRWFPTGVLVADLEAGEIPFLPGETPYAGLMSPDVGYAGLIGVAATPAMYVSQRIPSGTSITSPCYVVSYDLGLVTVPY